MRFQASASFEKFLTPIVLATLAQAQQLPGYDLRVVATDLAPTTGGTLWNIDPGVAINDAGLVAFSGTDAQGSRAFVVNGGLPYGVSALGANQLFEGVAINNQVPALVAVSQLVGGSSAVSYERLWPSSATQVAVTTGQSPADFDRGDKFVAVNDLGVMAYGASIGGFTATALCAGVGGPPTQLAVYPGSVTLCPAISNTNLVVVRDNAGNIVGWPYPSGAPKVFAAASSFATVGDCPGVSADGSVVAFAGNRGAGRGIFLSIAGSAGQHLVRVAGEGTDAFWGFDTDERIGVISSGNLSTGKQITVSFIGTKTTEGVYVVQLTALESGGVLSVAALPPTLIVERFWTVAGYRITSLFLRDGPNASGALAFLANVQHPSGKSQALLVATPEPDTDGDGLFDIWETSGVDVNHDGQVDLNLPALGASANQKDLFVEVDAMVGRQPLPATLDRVVAAFAAAPNVLVGNPNGANGIRLHYQLDEGNIPLAAFPQGWQQFDPIKAARFGTPSERADPNWSNIREAKRLVFRYVLFADQYGGNGSSGLAELPGNDCIVTLGHPSWGLNGGTLGGTPDQQAATFMHEFGHTLGLGHGGVDGVNRKPNYRSVMNYNWQMPWNYNRQFWKLDYSAGLFGALDESLLNEAAGIGGDPNVVVVAGPPNGRLVAEAGPVDWDGDGATTAGPVAADVSHWLNADPASPGQMLAPGADWDQILYSVRNSSDYADGSHVTSIGLAEITGAESAAADAACPAPGVYCSAKVNSLGCTPNISISGSTSLSGPDDLVLAVDQVLNQRPGVILWSRTPSAQPFGGGTLCVLGAQPGSVAVGSSGGSALPANDCSGTYSLPFTHAYMSSKGVLAGQMIFAQSLSRDPGLAPPNNLSLSAGIAFLVCP